VQEKRDSQVYESRVQLCQRLMSEKGIDALFLAPGPNMYYLSAFLEEPSERLLTLILPHSGEPLFVVPELYEDHVRSVSWVEDYISWKDPEDPNSVLSAALKQLQVSLRVVGVDTRMWSRFLLMLLAAAPNARFADAASVMSSLRIRKSRQEIELMKSSAEIADATFMEAVKGFRHGMREHEMAAKIMYELRRLGADGMAFEPVVGSGPNAAHPHYRSGHRELRRGDLVVLDFGCLYRGYNSDVTRTVAIGDCDAERKRAYSIVQSAQEEACEKAASGMEAQSLDKVARDIVESAGYGQFFIHRMGHGIGLEIHEEPYIVAGNSMKLENGMTFSIEPGIYVPGQYGVRIEDIVVIEAGKARRLNHSSRELMTL